MTRRRKLCLAVLAAAGIAAVVLLRRQRVVTEPDTPSAPTATPASPAPTQKPRWLPPVDGECPSGHDVKVNTRSGIFHLPGGRSYDRTVPDRCYATAADAEADGYRRAKA